MRFIRVRGRIVPINDSRPKQVGIMRGGLLGAAAGAAYGGLAKPHTTTKIVQTFSQVGDKAGWGLKHVTHHTFAKRAFKPALIGLGIGAAIGSLKFYKKNKKESQKNFAIRVSKG
jgi:hypothetical protein